MPFGLVNAMAVWSRFIDRVMDRFLCQSVLCYADDILIYTKKHDVNFHAKDLDNVFTQLGMYGVKIKASKLKLGLKEIPFLGF